jgi:hypothetical protein
LLDVDGQDLKVFHACGGVCRRCDRELERVEGAVGSPEDTEQEGWCGLAVDLVGGGGLERHCGWIGEEGGRIEGSIDYSRFLNVT